MNIRRLVFEPKIDKGGLLVSLEANHDVPFAIERVFFIWDVQPDAVRGSHAHRKIEEVLVCLRGSCRVHLDNGRERVELVLRHPMEGLYVGNLIWTECYAFSPDCTLMVLANERFDPKDYISDYEEFKQECRREAKE